MGIEDMETGNIEPVDLCNYCLFRGCAFDGEPIFSRNEKKEKQIEEYQRSLKNEITSAE
jgi:hypothetical protein